MKTMVICITVALLAMGLTGCSVNQLKHVTKHPHVHGPGHSDHAPGHHKVPPGQAKKLY